MDSKSRRSSESVADARDFRAAWLATPDVMCIVRTSDATLIEVNDAYESITGYSRAEVIGKSSYDFPWWANLDERDRVLTALRDHSRLDQAEVTFIGPHGPRSVLVSANPVWFQGQQCAVWRAVDITEQRQAERAQKALEERLRQKQNLERLGMLAGGIAHHFNNLLVGVLGNADVVLSMIAAESPLAGPLRAIAASAQGMAEHTRELLDYAGRGSAKLAPLRLDQLLTRVVDSSRTLAPTGVTVTLDADVTAWIRGDESQLTRMLLNLVKNAAEAFDPPSGVVEVSARQRGDQVEVRVRDGGHGMDEHTRASMFDPFFSTKRHGRGLGLSSVPMIVERHAGTMSVLSEPGKGTTISLLFPLESVAEGTELASPGNASAERKGHALVVDDERQVREVARAMLQHIGYDVTEAEDGESALVHLGKESHEFTFVVLDATMPGLDGRQTLERIRERYPELPVLLCSGYSGTDFAAQVSNQRHTSFLTKPFRKSQFDEAITSLLRGAAATS